MSTTRSGNHPFWARSVLVKLVLAVVAAGFVTGLLGSWMIAYSAGKALRTEIAGQNESLADSMALRLDDRIRTRVIALQVVATRADLEQLTPRAQSELNVVLKNLPEVEFMAVYDLTGRAVAAARSGGLEDVAAFPIRSDLLARLGDKPFDTAILSTGTPFLEVLVPMHNPPGTLSGVMVAHLPLELVAGYLVEPQFDRALTAFLIDASGNILVHPERNRVMDRERFEDPELSQGSFRSGEGDEARLYAVGSATVVPARVVLEQDERQALASVAEETGDLVAILVAVITITVMAVILTGRKLLAPLGPMAEAARRIRMGEHGARVSETGSGEVGRMGREFNRMAEALELRIAELKERKRTEERLREESQLADTLHKVGRALSAELDLQQVIQAVTDAATELTGAEFGAFYYNVTDGPEDESYSLYALAGVSREVFESFPMPRNPAIFGPTYMSRIPVRSDDISEHPDYGKSDPYFLKPEGPLPVRSYLAVSVVSRRGEVLGGLFFGHSQSGVFSGWDEKLVAGIAAQAGIAIENARLYAAQRSAAELLQQSLLPASLPQITGLETAARYLPAEEGIEVGGDWYDVLELAAGMGVGLVIGDVVGRGLPAAGTMGQLCHAVRAYALEDPSPGRVLTRLNAFLCEIGVEHQFATVIFAVFNPATGMLRIANAGHPPPLLILSDGSPELIHIVGGPPVGAMPGVEYQEGTLALPSHARLVFYTDGLVEDRNLSLDEGLEALKRVGSSAPADLEAFCDYILKEMTINRDSQDDVALLAFGGVAGDAIVEQPLARAGTG